MHGQNEHGSPNEAQGASGDSGGAAFFLNGSTWELAGIMGAVGTFAGQPASMAVFGDVTHVASIPAYHAAIMTAIPKPAEVGLWFAAGAGVSVFLRRRISTTGL